MFPRVKKHSARNELNGGGGFAIDDENKTKHRGPARRASSFSFTVTYDYRPVKFVIIHLGGACFSFNPIDVAVNRAAVGPLRIFAVASPDAIRLTGRGEPGTGPVENASRCSRFRDNRMAFRRKLGRVVGVVRRGNSVAGASVSRRARGGGN